MPARGEWPLSLGNRRVPCGGGGLAISGKTQTGKRGKALFPEKRGNQEEIIFLQPAGLPTALGLVARGAHLA